MPGKLLTLAELAAFQDAPVAVRWPKQQAEIYGICTKVYTAWGKGWMIIRPINGRGTIKVHEGRVRRITERVIHDPPTIETAEAPADSGSGGTAQGGTVANALCGGPLPDAGSVHPRAEQVVSGDSPDVGGREEARGIPKDI